MKANMSYDYKTDTLYIYPQSRTYSSSIQEENFIVDISTNNELQALEILDASKTLSLDKDLLQNATQATLRMQVQHNQLQIDLHLSYTKRNHQQTGKYAHTMPAPQGIQHSNIELALT